MRVLFDAAAGADPVLEVGVLNPTLSPFAAWRAW